MRSRMVGFLVVGLLLAVLVGRPNGPAPTADAQTPPATDDAARTRELAERLLLQPYGGPYAYVTLGAGETEPPRVQLLVGQLPPDLPPDLPRPAGARLLGSLVRTGGLPSAGGARVEVVLDAPGTPSTLQAFFDEAFAAQGWSPPPALISGPSGGGGFQPQPGGPTSRIFCPADAQGYVTVSLRPLTETTADVRLGVYPAAPTPTASGLGGYATPCAVSDLTGAPSRPFSYQTLQSPIPALTPPAGVGLQSMGQSGGSGSWSSEALAQTELSASALEQHFQQQLAEAGWILSEQGASGSLAWSSWRVESETQEWYGMLLVLELPVEQRRVLSVRAYSPTGQIGPSIIRGG